MNRKSFSAAVATGVLTVGLVLGAPTAANAKVTAKDVPSKADIVKAFPELAGGTFKAAKGKKISVPGKTCGATKNQKVKSAVSNVGTYAAEYPEMATTVITGASEFKSTSQAKGYLKKFNSFLKKCKSFTEPTTGATVTLKKVKAPKLGQDRVALVQTTTIAFGEVTIETQTRSIVIRQGKRIGQVAAIDDAAISTKAINKLAKVAAKKLK